MNRSDLLEEVLTVAANFSVEHESYIIDDLTIVIGILRHESPFSDILSREEKEIALALISEKLFARGKYEHKSDPLPCTMTASMLFRFSEQYALEIGDGELDVYHVLLALLSYNNEAAEIFSRLGWTFETCLGELNKIISPEIVTNRLELKVEPSVKNLFSLYQKTIWTPEDKEQVAVNLEDEAYRFSIFGRYATSRQLCEIILDLSPERTYPHYLIFGCLTNEKRYREAIDYYETHRTAIENPGLSYGLCYFETGQHQKAIEIYESIEEKDAPLLNAWAFALLELGKYDEAITVFDQAIKVDPEYAYAYNNKGYALMKKGNLFEAKELVSHSLALDKGNSYAYRNLALIYIEEKNKHGALAAIEKALLFRYRENFGNDIDKSIEQANAL